MPRKRLPHYQILRVDEVNKREGTAVSLRAISLDELRSVEAPDGTWTSHVYTLILPKRKRGTKFRVTYTDVFWKEL
jgi:hypothetical protein